MGKLLPQALVPLSAAAAVARLQTILDKPRCSSRTGE
jgi:hypothetical protein